MSLKRKATRSFERPVTIYHTTRRIIPKKNLDIQIQLTVVCLVLSSHFNCLTRWLSANPLQPWRDFTAQQGHYKITRLYVCISWLCNRFPKREMAQGHSHTIKINVSAVYQEALGSQHSTAAPHVLADSLVSTDMWLRIPYYYFRTPYYCVTG